MAHARRAAPPAAMTTAIVSVDEPHGTARLPPLPQVSGPAARETTTALTANTRLTTKRTNAVTLMADLLLLCRRGPAGNFQVREGGFECVGPLVRNLGPDQVYALELLESLQVG